VAGDEDQHGGIIAEPENALRRRRGRVAREETPFAARGAES
jgi:hypothetical protein